MTYRQTDRQNCNVEDQEGTRFARPNDFNDIHKDDGSESDFFWISKAHNTDHLLSQNLLLGYNQFNMEYVDFAGLEEIEIV